MKVLHSLNLVFLVDLKGRPESRRVDSILRGRPKKNVDPKKVDPKNVDPKKGRSKKRSTQMILMGRP